MQYSNLTVLFSTTNPDNCLFKIFYTDNLWYTLKIVITHTQSKITYIEKKYHPKL